MPIKEQLFPVSNNTVSAFPVSMVHMVKEKTNEILLSVVVARSSSWDRVKTNSLI